jgi:hypothetical protein
MLVVFQADSSDKISNQLPNSVLDCNAMRH